jgi:nickel/cobalt exporter
LGNIIFKLVPLLNSYPMDTSINILLVTAISIGFIHTIAGPDHYLPFVAIAKSRNWMLGKTIAVVAICGIGHVLGSVVIGLIGIAAGISIKQIELIEGFRGNIASWLLFGAGAVYTIWAIIHKARNKGIGHSHNHSEKKQITFWVLFTIFVFGPCEPLIPILMYPAAELNFASVMLIAGAFALSTIAVMISATVLLLKGIEIGRFNKIEQYKHILAGATLTLSGASIIFLGL